MTASPAGFPDLRAVYWVGYQEGFAAVCVNVWLSMSVCLSAGKGVARSAQRLARLAGGLHAYWKWREASLPCLVRLSAACLVRVAGRDALLCMAVYLVKEVVRSFPTSLGVAVCLPVSWRCWEASPVLQGVVACPLILQS